MAQGFAGCLRRLRGSNAAIQLLQTAELWEMGARGLREKTAFLLRHPCWSRLGAMQAWWLEAITEAELAPATYTLIGNSPGFGVPCAHFQPAYALCNASSHGVLS